MKAIKPLCKRTLLSVSVCLAPVITVAGDDLSIESLTALYQERIEHLELGIRNETKRRTTILSQLDSTINNINALEEEHNSTTRNNPRIDENLQQIDNELRILDSNINTQEMMLQELTEALQQYPQPTVWQAALGNPQLAKQQKSLAMQRYLVHDTKRQLQHLDNRKQQLTDKRSAVTEYEKGVSESIRKLHLRTAASLEQSQNLEQQLARIASDIVKKQDRLTLLTERAALLGADSEALNFKNLQKKLWDPVNGELLRDFAEPKAKGLLKWNGILISADLGVPFNAVSDGLVVFADQIHGLGNVAIVDHSDGYMSLYGMAELLMVQTDQFLLAGDPIGTVGESVGLDASALYFEIRHNADTLDPQDWLEMHRISQKNAL